MIEIYKRVLLARQNLLQAQELIKALSDASEPMLTLESNVQGALKTLYVPVEIIKVVEQEIQELEFFGDKDILP